MRLLSLLSILFCLSGCTQHMANDNSMVALDDYQWHLVSVNDRPVSPVEGRTQVMFSKGQVMVSGLCNTLSGSAVFKGDRVSFGALRSTLMACTDNSLMAHEEAFSTHLAKVETWSVDNGPATPVLTLSQASGEFIRLRGEPTPEKRYGSRGETIFLEIKPEKVACNHPLIPNFKCLYVRALSYNEQGVKTVTGDWQYFYDSIQQYEHREDTRVVLRVKRYPVKDAPADASRFVYINELIVEQERVVP